MTVLFVGDVHLKSARVLPAVDRAVAATGANEIVFLGDVCDDWDVTARQAVVAVRMFADWVHARRAAMPSACPTSRARHGCPRGRAA